VYMFSLNLIASILNPSVPRGTNIKPRAEDRSNKTATLYYGMHAMELLQGYYYQAQWYIQQLERKWTQPVPQFSPSLWWLQTHNMLSPQLMHLQNLNVSL
jgi:hypothetical protein